MAIYKEFSSLNLSKHRSAINAFVHIIAAITAYQINPFKPKLNLQPRYPAILNLHERIENKLFLDRTRKDFEFQTPSHLRNIVSNSLRSAAAISSKQH